MSEGTNSTVKPQDEDTQRSRRRRTFSGIAQHSEENNYQPLEEGLEYNEIDLDDTSDDKK